MIDLPAPPSWVDDAVCASTDPESWFPPQGSHLGPIAAAICRTCPVRQACLDYALEKNITYGIWGGKTERQRRDIRKRRKDAAAAKPINHGTEVGYQAHRRRGEDACVPCERAATEARRLRHARRTVA